MFYFSPVSTALKIRRNGKVFLLVKPSLYRWSLNLGHQNSKVKTRKAI